MAEIRFLAAAPVRPVVVRQLLRLQLLTWHATAWMGDSQVPKSVKKKLRELDGHTDQAEEEDEDEEVDRLTAEDAYLFPVFGSVVLFALFVAFKYLDKALLNKILGYYLAVMSVGALARTAARGLKAVWGVKRLKTMDKLADAGSSVNTVEALAEEELGRAIPVHLHPPAPPRPSARQYTGHWVLSNLVALAFAYNAISLLYLDSFLTGAILLSGLFLYDIWWVFGSPAVFGPGADVMVSVAKNFNAPIKIVFPKELATASDFTLLGLGDIVLPGVFLALALRFDYHLALKRAPSSASAPPRPSSAFPKRYFSSCFGAYIAGLATTIFVMHTFRAAQPALLYLSPACIGSVVLTAWARGEVKEMWGWIDGEEDEKAKKAEEAERKKNKKPQEDEVEGEDDEKVEETSESTSIEVDGGTVLRSRVQQA
ncbi:SPOSA6832_01167 [Sporobolomyces salmonicolor]|uniref:SPOSA6832_01167-mRNA-1:cds n=1 Tax=Sporidiobolus salmonicolor TaxID=5005 RepID=A0A0D6EI25_SPOSA|nr:SPOSA6832_01167 [Sporobolomyces salmonicolor]